MPEFEEQMRVNAAQEYHDWIIENQYLKQRIEPQHAAALVTFLVSPASDMITKQIFNVDGGW